MTVAAAPPGTDPRTIAGELLEARERTLLLVAPLTDEDLRRQHDPLMSPILWDLGHIAHFEELWLTQNLDGKIEFSEMPGIYNPFEHPRATRASLPIPPLTEMKERLDEIREKVLDRLERTDLYQFNSLRPGGNCPNIVFPDDCSRQTDIYT